MIWPKKRKYINESLIEHASCPVCFEDMIGNIWQCHNGHILCNDCSKRKECKSCPECRDQSPKTRNIVLEQIFSKMESKCKFCQEKMSTEYMKHHIELCNKKPIKCCSFNFECNVHAQTASELIEHLRTEHNFKLNTCQAQTDFFRSFTTKFQNGFCNWTPILNKIMKEDKTLGYACIMVSSTVNNYFVRVFRITDRLEKKTKIKMHLKCGSSEFRSLLVENLDIEHIEKNHEDELEPFVISKNFAHKTYMKENQNTDIKGFSVCFRFDDCE